MKYTIDTYFDKVFYLNMDKDIDRNENMISQFKKYNISNYERIGGAVIDFIPDFSYWRNFNSQFINEKYVKGQLGCRNTHWRAVEEAYKRGYNRVMIFEDDVTIKEDPNKILNENISSNTFWDMIYYGGTEEPHFGGQIVCAHAYALNRKLIEEIYFMLPHSGMEVDNFYAKVLYHMSSNYSPTGKFVIKKMNPFNTIVQSSDFKSNSK